MKKFAFAAAIAACSLGFASPAFAVSSHAHGGAAGSSNGAAHRSENGSAHANTSHSPQSLHGCAGLAKAVAHHAAVANTRGYARAYERLGCVALEPPAEEPPADTGSGDTGTGDTGTGDTGTGDTGTGTV